MSLEPGVRLGPYEIVGPLGAGGMGEVYRARIEPDCGFATFADNPVASAAVAAAKIAAMVEAVGPLR